MNRHSFTIELIQEAGEVLLQAQKKGFSVTHKNGDTRNVLTDVDLEVNEFISAKIHATYSEDFIRSEEVLGGETMGNFWSIDPIDGTSNFARSIPHFAIVISYLENGNPVVGAIYNPITKELFSFEKDKGAFLNGAPISASKTATLKDAYVMLHIGRKKEVQEWGINLQRTLITMAKKNMNLGSSALDLAFLAAGRVDAVIYGTMTTLDIAVAASLVRAAGGEVYSLDGTPVEFNPEPQQIIATSSKALFTEISAI